MSEVRPTDNLTGAERKSLIDSMRPEDAADVPELNDVDVPEEPPHRDRDGDGQVPADPLGLDPGPVGGAAPATAGAPRRGSARRPP